MTQPIDNDRLREIAVAALSAHWTEKFLRSPSGEPIVVRAVKLIEPLFSEALTEATESLRKENEQLLRYRGQMEMAIGSMTASERQIATHTIASCHEWIDDAKKTLEYAAQERDSLRQQLEEKEREIERLKKCLSEPKLERE
jgi:septin family protein